MAVVLKAAVEVSEKYLTALWSYADPRTEHLPLVRNPLGVATILGLYLYFVNSLGPRLMKNRKPFDLSRTMLVYNALQVVWCAYLVVEALRLGWGWRYSFLCEPLADSMEPEDFEVAKLVYAYFILKIVDLLDTVFMVLRKSFRQISFLHVYHHAGMVFGIWLGVKIFPGGHHTLLGLINSVVHCALYGYYFLALYRPEAKSAWWKKYITLVQITQFGINFVHEVIPILMVDCGVDKRISALLAVQNLFFCALFTDFYIKIYKNKDTMSRNKKS